MKSNIVQLPRQQARKESPTAALEEAFESVISELALLAGKIVDSLLSARDEGLKQIGEVKPTESLMTFKETAAYLNCSERTLCRMTSPGRITVPFIIFGGEKRFRLRDVDRALDERTFGKQKIKL